MGNDVERSRSLIKSKWGDIGIHSAYPPNKLLILEATSRPTLI
jgi:hypothetical protein